MCMCVCVCVCVCVCESHRKQVAVDRQLSEFDFSLVLWVLGISFYYMGLSGLIAGTFTCWAIQSTLGCLTLNLVPTH